MFCVVYKSGKKTDTYLYIEKKDDFTRVPTQLLAMLGRLDWVMELNLETRERLANTETSTVQRKLEQEGFYLQMPPAHYQTI